jgi:hypothetical protein
MLAVTGETGAAAGAAARDKGTARWANPAVLFWVAGLLVYGGAAVNFANGHYLDQTMRDLWQHLAALRALIENPFDPANPFVVSSEGSRHFHPYWVGTALLARLLGWNEWQALGFAGFVSAGVLLAGIWTFGRAFYRNAWGPLALLLAMVFGWSFPISHTGYHSPETLIEGIAYPAALLIGLSLLSWGLLIRALEAPRLAWLLLPLSAFMFATHQLGAGIGFMASGCFLLFWPHGTLRARVVAGAAIAAGILLSAAWPYHSPIDAVFRTGNATWTGGLNFYSWQFLVMACVPGLIGLWGLCHQRFRRQALPVLAAFVLFAGIFAVGAAGVLIATRFVMPAVLMLQIGIGALLILGAERWHLLKRPARLAAFGGAMLVVQVHLILLSVHLRSEYGDYRRHGSAHAAALRLTADIPDNQPVAAFDVVAWPIVATGQKAVSVPWPEPMIDNLAERQAAAERLFYPGLSRDERLALARRWGAKTLILDERGPNRRRMPAGLLQTLEGQSVRHSRDGAFRRFDLE